jgi:hypothetical protein
VFRPGSQNLLVLGSEGALACGLDQAPSPVGRSAKPAPIYDAIQLPACSSRTRSPNAAAVARKNAEGLFARRLLVKYTDDPEEGAIFDQERALQTGEPGG